MEKLEKIELEWILESIEHCFPENHKLIGKLKRNIREMELKKKKK
jgi:hypothetical protein